jgi:hypothetical protein
MDPWQCISEKGEESSGRKASCPDPGSRRRRVWTKARTRQHKFPTSRIADPSSTNAVNFSSARTTKRFPLSRCASAIQIVRRLESIAQTQPQFQPALGIVGHLRRRSATADSSCGEFARFKSATGRTRCGELGAHLLDLRRLFLHRCCEGRHS